MRPSRVSIASLMAVVVFIAVGLAALLRPAPLWAAAMSSTVLAVLTISLLGLILRRGRARAFWVGVAIAGWLAAIVHFAPWFRNAIRPMLLSTALLDLLYEQTAPTPPPNPTGGGMGMGGMGGSGFGSGFGKPTTTPGKPANPPPPPPGPLEVWTTQDRTGWSGRTVGGMMIVPTPSITYERIGSCLVVLLCAMIGGLVGQWFTSPDREREHATSSS